jgi:hypothetical protein
MTNTMKKTLVAMTAATALAAGTMTAPNRAEALAQWVIPAIVAAGVGGVAVGGTVAAASTPAYVEPGGTVYVRPATEPRSCFVARERLPDGRLRRIRVCN